MNTKFIVTSILGLFLTLSIGSLSDHSAGAALATEPGTCNASLVLSSLDNISTNYPTLVEEAQKADHNGNGWVCFEIKNGDHGNSGLGPVAAFQDDRF